MRLTRAAFMAALAIGNACNSASAQLPDIPPALNLVEESRGIDLSVEEAVSELDSFHNRSAHDEPIWDASLSLERLQAMALANSPSIQSAAALVSAGRGKSHQVGLQPNPQVGFDFQQLGSNGQAEQYGVLLGQQIVRSEKLQLNRSIELHEVHRLGQQLEAARWRVLTDVHVAYVRALRAQRQIDISRELLTLDKKALIVAEQLLEAKDLSRTDVLRAEIGVENAEGVLNDAELRHVAAWRELQAVTGQPDMLAVPLAGDLFSEPRDFVFDRTLERLQSQSPEISALVATIERAQCNLRRQQVEPKPNVTVNGLFNWRDNGIGGGPDAALSVSVPLPVWDQNRGAIQEARYQLVSANQELERTRLALASRLSPVFERLNSARHRVDRFQNRIIPKAEETVGLVRETYELGEVNLDALLQTQRILLQTRLAYVDAAEQLRLAEAEIDGMLLSGSLK